MSEQMKEYDQKKGQLEVERSDAVRSFSQKIEDLEKERMSVLANFIESICPYRLGDIVMHADRSRYKITNIDPTYSQFSELCGFRVLGRKISRNKKMSVNITTIFELPTPRYKKIEEA